MDLLYQPWTDHDNLGHIIYTLHFSTWNVESTAPLAAATMSGFPPLHRQDYLCVCMCTYEYIWVFLGS